MAAVGWLGCQLPECGLAAEDAAARPAAVKIVILDPPEKEFFSKLVDFQGFPIKAHKDVSDEAMQAAFDKLSMMLQQQPQVISNIAAAGAELHIIGRNQVTTDLPEWRHDKGKALAEYNGLTRDQRTRGMGGRLTSCGEENLLKLPGDRYAGRDICAHEFTHCIYQYGVQPEVRARIREQYDRSLAKGLWKKAYAATNPNEFFAEMTMWYFGTHGDLHMEGTKPANGPDGLKQYDPDAFTLVDDFYSGRIQVTRVEPRPRRVQSADEENAPASVPRPGPAAVVQ